MVDIHIRRARDLATLPDLVNTHGRGTGAVPINPDSRLLALREWTFIRASLQGGLPASASLIGYITGPPYDQRPENACVAFSTASMQSLYSQILGGRWLRFDADECYHANGGLGSNGVSPIDVLEWDKRVGLRDVSSGLRYKIVGYGLTNPTITAGQEEIKAAIASRRPAVLAMLLPSDFDEQWGKSGNCAGTVTNAFHQVCVCGYDSQRCYFLNSWGPTWGQKGVGSICWDFIQEPVQNSWAYAYVTTDSYEPSAAAFFRN
jgi:hypothetical protein